MGNGSWICQKLLKLRDIACQFLRFEVKDGLDTFFWHENWLHLGKLIDITGPTGPNLLGIPLNVKVADALGKERWRAHCSHVRQFPALRNEILALPFVPALGDKDKFLWHHSQREYCDSFSASHTWEQLRQVKPKVSWERIIWFAQGVPQYSFIIWLAIWNRLSTGFRMRSWGQTQGCMLCGEPDKTRDHLYFACLYSFTIWLRVGGGLLADQASPDWTDTLNFLHLGGHNLMDQILLCMVYCLWQERNTRRHEGPWIPHEQTSRLIIKAVKNRIFSLGYRFPHKLIGLLRRWIEVT